MTHISDLFDTAQLDKMLTQGYVTQQRHPWLPLRIFNYARKTQFERMWNNVTKQCRGLIVDDYGQVVARPFPKFFNLGEMDDSEIPNEPFQVFAKMDGSLGILYPDFSLKCGYAVATRGSFVSEQADWASQYLAGMMSESGWSRPFTPAPNLTYLFEIIYPENRIVVDYGGMRSLVLLDVIDNDSGRSAMSAVQDGCYALGARWPGQAVRHYDYIWTIEQVEAAKDPGNAEGFVIRWNSGERAKFKFDEYVRLHRILTNVSTRTVWEWLVEGKSLDELLESTPDEFDTWVNDTARELTAAAAHVADEVYRDYHDALEAAAPAAGDQPIERKHFAGAAQHSKHRAALFLLFDGRDITAYCWQQVKPQFAKAFTNDKDS